MASDRRRYHREYYRRRISADPEFRERRKQLANSPKRKLYIREYMRKYTKRRYHSDPEYRRKVLESQRHYVKSSPKARARRAAYQREMYKRNRRISNAAKNRPCTDCGGWYDSCVMQFDHLPQYRKHFTISNNLLQRTKRLLAEIKKCEVVCANCHAIRTALRKAAQLTVTPNING